ncbi:MAG: DUF459 domain-containing protein [Hyphomicrobiaceae bacterium]
MVTLVAVLVTLFGAAAAVPVARSQTADDGGFQSYIAPFPNGERHRVLVIGDALANGMHGGLVEIMGGDPRVEIDRRHRWLSGFSRREHADEVRDLVQSLKRDRVSIAVVMVGTQDRWSLRSAEGRRLAVGSREWRDEIARRVDETMRALRAAGPAVYWVGLPVMRREEVDEAAQAMNDVLRERAYLSGIKFIDVYAGFADEDGEYSAYGPDLSGKTRQLRDRDGIGMTEPGYAKLAHFVETELKRDLAQARSERAIPLAGNEEEQARVRPAPRGPASRSGQSPGTDGATGAATFLRGEVGAGDQKADNGRITLKPAGREDPVVIEIVRPAIPEAVIALVTKSQSADKPSAQGDSVVDQIPGGLTVISSITPSGDGAAAGGRRRLSPAQTPFFRVLVKGERLAARPGRADDVSWPKPDPPAAPRADLTDERDDAGLATAAIPARANAGARRQPAEPKR